MDDHPVAIEAPAQKFVGCAPKIKAKTAIVEVAKSLDDEITIGFEIARPLLKSQKIAIAIIQEFRNAQRRLRQSTEKIMENQK